MTTPKDETRSWPDTGDGDEAVSALRDGLDRVRQQVAAFREVIHPTDPEAGATQE